MSSIRGAVGGTAAAQEAPDGESQADLLKSLLQLEELDVQLLTLKALNGLDPRDVRSRLKWRARRQCLALLLLFPLHKLKGVLQPPLGELEVLFLFPYLK